MTEAKPMDIKVGDTVHVRGEIVEVGDTFARVRFEGDYVCVALVALAVLRKAIVHVEPRPLAVGDKVTWGKGVEVYNLLAIHKARAWMCSDAGFYHEEWITDLRRVP